MLPGSTGGKLLKPSRKRDTSPVPDLRNMNLDLRAALGQKRQQSMPMRIRAGAVVNGVSSTDNLFSSASAPKLQVSDDGSNGSANAPVGSGVRAGSAGLTAPRLGSQPNLFAQRGRGGVGTHQEVLSSLVRHGTVSSSYLIAYGLLQHQNRHLVKTFFSLNRKMTNQ
jgi:hypothetical protein